MLGVWYKSVNFGLKTGHRGQVISVPVEEFEGGGLILEGRILHVWCLSFGVWVWGLDFGFGVRVLGFGVWGLRFGGLGLGFGVPAPPGYTSAAFTNTLSHTLSLSHTHTLSPSQSHAHTTPPHTHTISHKLLSLSYAPTPIHPRTYALSLARALFFSLFLSLPFSLAYTIPQSYTLALFDPLCSSTHIRRV